MDRMNFKLKRTLIKASADMYRDITKQSVILSKDYKYITINGVKKRLTQQLLNEMIEEQVEVINALYCEKDKLSQ